MSAPSKLAGRVFFCAVKMVTFSPKKREHSRKSGNILWEQSFLCYQRAGTFNFFQFENVPANVTKNVTRKNPKTLEKQGFLSEW